MVKYGGSVKKDGKQFGKARALGLLWEKGAKTALNVGVGSLQADALAVLRLSGGDLKLKKGISWRKQLWIDIDMEPGDRELIRNLVQSDWVTLGELGFQVTRVDVRDASGTGSADMVGFWADATHMESCPGLVAYEKKMFSSRGFDRNVEKAKNKCKQQFLERAQSSSSGARFTGQLLSVSEVKDDTVVDTKVFYCSSVGANWNQLHAPRPGWPVVHDKLRIFTAPKGKLKGVRVASVGSYLEALGKDKKAGYLKIPQWTNGSLPGVASSHFDFVKLEQQTGGKGWVASIDTLSRIYRLSR